MMEIRHGETGTILLSGRFDASQERMVREFLDAVTGEVVLDFSGLEYISSAGLGTLLATQKRLKATGGGIRIINPNKHIRDIFFFSGLTTVLEVQDPPAGS